MHASSARSLSFVGPARAFVAVLFALGSAVPVAAQQQPEPHAPDAIAPFRIIDNIYYLAGKNESVFLITTPAGHILMDSGDEETVVAVRDAVARLGFNLRDIKLILTSHGHADHVAGYTQAKEMTGGTIVSSEQDAALIESGGKGDYRLAGRPSPRFWKPVKVDRIVRDGEQVALGGVTLTAHITPGHTKGNLTWTTIVEEEGKKLNVLFAPSMRVNTEVPMLDNPEYPALVDDFERSFEVLKALPCDVFLAPHERYFGLQEKAARLKSGERPNPFVDPQGCRQYVAYAEQSFRDELMKQRSGR